MHHCARKNEESKMLMSCFLNISKICCAGLSVRVLSTQSPTPPRVLALLPGRSWRKYSSTIKLWLFEQNPFCLSSARIICSMDFCPSVSLSIAFLYDVPFYCKNCSTLYIFLLDQTFPLFHTSGAIFFNF